MVDIALDRFAVLKNKNILIGDGTTGTGWATAKILAGLGARLFIFGKDPDDLERSFRRIRKSYPDVVIFGATADITNESHLQRIFHAFDAELGMIDVFVSKSWLSDNDDAILPSKSLPSPADLQTIGHLRTIEQTIIRMAMVKKGHIVLLTPQKTPTDKTISNKELALDSLGQELNTMGIKLTVVEEPNSGSLISTSKEKPRSSGTNPIAEQIIYALCDSNGI